jgi:TPR repeat protein
MNKGRRTSHNAVRECHRNQSEGLHSLSPLHSVRTPAFCRLVPPDVPAALVHYMFAANAGDPVAQMTLGYRHLLGIDVPKSCQTGVWGTGGREGGRE